MRTIADILDLWPDVDRRGAAHTVAEDLGVTLACVRAWRQRGSIPSPYFAGLVESARKRGLADQVTYEALALACADRRAAGGDDRQHQTPAAA